MRILLIILNSLSPWVEYAKLLTAPPPEVGSDARLVATSFFFNHLVYGSPTLNSQSPLIHHPLKLAA
jgi:hypothetical protein